MGPDVISKLEELLVKSQTLKHAMARAKRVKLVKSELNKAKKNSVVVDSPHSDLEIEPPDVKTSTQSTSGYFV